VSLRRTLQLRAFVSWRVEIKRYGIVTTPVTDESSRYGAVLGSCTDVVSGGHRRQERDADRGGDSAGRQLDELVSLRLCRSLVDGAGRSSLLSPGLAMGTTNVLCSTPEVSS
jgi:hypothetical protein